MVDAEIGCLAPLIVLVALNVDAGDVVVSAIHVLPVLNGLVLGIHDYKMLGC